jgi:hypothetical protein
VVLKAAVAGQALVSLAALIPITQAAAEENSWRPDLVALDESGNRNIPNYMFGPGRTAGGHFQITDTNWRHYAPLLDIDLAKYPNAMSATEQLQGQVAGRMYAETGYMPWVPYNSQLRRHLEISGPSTAQAIRAPSPPTAQVDARPHDWDVFPDEAPEEQQPPASPTANAVQQTSDEVAADSHQASLEGKE